LQEGAGEALTVAVVEREVIAHPLVQAEAVLLLRIR
jgi:hypothetical protein